MIKVASLVPVKAESGLVFFRKKKQLKRFKVQRFEEEMNKRTDGMMNELFFWKTAGERGLGKRRNCFSPSSINM